VFGYAKKLLKVNLTTGVISEKHLSEEIIRKYVGGRGLGVALLAETTQKGMDPMNPEAPIFFLTGPLTGTLAPGAAKYVVVFKSPVTGGYCDSYASGRIAIEIKAAGYDGIMITGKSPQPSVLVVNGDKISIKKAESLWGCDTFETENRIRQKYGEGTGIACIGPAGENLVMFSAINSDYFRQAARGGGGAVMGSKNLKAIAVRGNKGVKCYDGYKLMELVTAYKDKLAVSEHAQKRMKYGTPLTMNFTNALGMLPTKNFQEGSFPPAVGVLDGDGFLKDVINNRGCIGCMIACSKIVKATEGKFEGELIEGPEYETLALLGSNVGNTDRSVVIHSNVLCDKLGMDTISAGGIIAFLMECYEKGIVTKEQCNGYEMYFGNSQAQIQLLKDIAYRRGIGDILANGVREAAKEIGGGSERYAMHVKGLELPGYEPRAGFGVALAYAVCSRGGCHRRAWPPAIESLGKLRPDTTEQKAEMLKGLSDSNCISHSLLVCDFPIKMAPVTANNASELYNAVTGESLTGDDLEILADRVETTIRLYNNREGLARTDDTLPNRFFDEQLGGPVPDLGERLTRKALNVMLDEYYQLRGWDTEGVPIPKTIKQLAIPEQLRL
jgi:aldehyde:ferredoxin oxidoreductase